jgi:hypothetical protein
MPISAPVTLRATRYVTPLREGGSLPAIIEADNDGTYVIKFRGAGQGLKSLIAEWIVGELARFLGLPIPEIVLLELDPILARAEPDPEIQELIQRSAGLNLALDYLPGSISFDPLVPEGINAELAAGVVWLDAFTTNVDRTARNSNMLIWHHQLWLIDHGAALYFHHSWLDYLQKSQTPFSAIKDHVLLPFTTVESLQQIHQDFSQRITREVLTEIVSHLPEAWLIESPFENPDLHRQAYVDYFVSRLAHADVFVEAAQRALV